jgi:hypothetical protein
MRGLLALAVCFAIGMYLSYLGVPFWVFVAV